MKRSTLKKIRYILSFRILVICLFAIVSPGCEEDTVVVVNPFINVRGLWSGQITIQSCVPTDVCGEIQLPVGPISTTMTLSQSDDRVQGTYAYNSTPLTGSVSGLVDKDQLTLNGTAISNGGQVTIQFRGTVIVNLIRANVEHLITLSDGRTATATGSGDLFVQ